MEFVVHVLEKFLLLVRKNFTNNAYSAQTEVAVVGVYSHDIAETKVTQVMDYSEEPTPVPWRNNCSQAGKGLKHFRQLAPSNAEKN